MPLPIREFLIDKIVSESSEVKSFYLSPLDGKPIHFLPGQFVMISLELPNGRNQRNAYSISSSPLQTSTIRITLSLHGEFTQALFQKKPGDKLKIDGPWGKFVLDESSPLDAVFIAGGVGITPLISMIKYLHETKSQRRIFLFYSSHSPSHLIFLSELSSMAQQNQNFKTIYCITGKGEAPENIKCYRRRIDAEMLSLELGQVQQKQYYICGPPPMVEGIVNLLEQMGVAYENIKNERW
ncbi:MAG: FAD-binding oxidoreductase [Candidatus Anstonellales archaeon]